MIKKIFLIILVYCLLSNFCYSQSKDSSLDDVEKIYIGKWIKIDDDSDKLEIIKGKTAIKITRNYLSYTKDIITQIDYGILWNKVLFIPKNGALAMTLMVFVDDDGYLIFGEDKYKRYK